MPRNGAGPGPTQLLREIKATNLLSFGPDGLSLELRPLNVLIGPNGRSVPYGLYDLQRNQGYVRVGTSADTPQFAVEGIRGWWEQEGMAAFPGATGLLVLADAGGSNSCRSRVWKQQLQEQLCDRFGLTVTVCHYPTVCSKWNPVEHRLFGPISVNWAGHPLRSWETMLAYLRAPRQPPGCG